MEYLDDYDLAKPGEIVHQGEDKKYKKTWVQELVHWRSVDGGVAAQDMKKFCTKALSPNHEQKHMAVKTIFFRPECLQGLAAAADQNS